MKNKSILIIWVSCILLLITFSLSFINSNTKDTRKAVKTSLLNPKNINNLSDFILSDMNRKLYFHKNTYGLWEVTDQSYEDEYEGKLLCNQKRMELFIQELSKIINIYKITDKNNSASYGLSESSKNIFILSYILNDGSTTTLSFGNYDFSENYRYFSPDGNIVYEISKNLDTYLSIAVQSWAESEILGKPILGTRTSKDVESIVLISETKNERIYSSDPNFLDYSSSLFSLLHGGFPTNYKITEKPETTVILDFGDKTQLSMEIFPTTEENDYVLKLNYNDSVNQKVFNNCMKISSWTYNKIKTSKL